MTRRPLDVLAGIAVMVAAVLVAIGLLTLGRPPARPAAHPPPGAAPARPVHWRDGVALASLRDLPAWMRATGEYPGIVQLYTGLTQPFPAGPVRQVLAMGALPLIQVNPRHATLAGVAAGRYDAWLRADAAAIAGLHHRVAISFAHEMNGSWYSWGCHQPGADPAEFIAAWRHVHDVIGTTRVTWVWTADHAGQCPLLDRWPGAAYVDLAGVDGYLRHPGDTWSSVFGPAVGQLRQLGLPVLLTEAGVPLGPDAAARIRSLYAGARAAGLAGVVWFDSATRKGDYRPQDNPQALAAFRAAIGGTR